MNITTGPYTRITDVNYICSLSKKVRDGVHVTRTNLKSLVEQQVDNFESDPELCKSLKVRPEPGKKLVRQVDIRPEPGHPTILLKTFMSWSHEHQAWHVMIEGPDEMVFENGEPNY